MKKTTTAEPVSGDQILRRERVQGNIHFPCSPDHEQDWQPYPVDSYSSYMCDHTNTLPALAGFSSSPCSADRKRKRVHQRYLSRQFSVGYYWLNIVCSKKSQAPFMIHTSYESSYPSSISHRSYRCISDLANTFKKTYLVIYTVI